MVDGARRCADKADRIVDAIEAAKNPDGDALAMWCKGPAVGSTAKRSANIAEKWANNQSSSPAYRIDALKALVACDPKRGKTLAAAMAKESDEYIQREASALAQ